MRDGGFQGRVVCDERPRQEGFRAEQDCVALNEILNARTIEIYMTTKTPISETDLILNSDGSVYHLHLLPGDIADTVFLVGDPARVPKISKHFDRVELEKQNRSFLTHTGYIGKERVSVMSTGIGTGCIDIVLNELDALVNLDLTNRQPNKTLKSLNLIRLGTCGGLQANVPVNTCVATQYSFAFDAIVNYYAYSQSSTEQAYLAAVKQHFQKLSMVDAAYGALSSPEIFDVLAKEILVGMTFTCPGFYGAQGRTSRVPLMPYDLLDTATSFSHAGIRTLNFEMETATLFTLGQIFGHQCASVCVILANRATQTMSAEIEKAIEGMITKVLTLLL